jgi:hypothetical protein
MSEDGSGFPPRTWFGTQPVTAVWFFFSQRFSLRGRDEGSPF